MARNKQTPKRFWNVMTVCRVCGKKTHSQFDGMYNHGLCRDCFDDCSEENSWVDNGCPECSSTNYEIVTGKTKLGRDVLTEIKCRDCGRKYRSRRKDVQ